MEPDKPEQTAVNNRGTGSGSDPELTRVRSLPVLYELIDKEGRKLGHYGSAQAAAEAAAYFFPDQEQDPDRTGKGWDIQVVGAE